jgi:hypothetical protein
MRPKLTQPPDTLLRVPNHSELGTDDDLRLPAPPFALSNDGNFVNLWREALRYTDTKDPRPLRACLAALLGNEGTGNEASAPVLLDAASRLVMACQAAHVLPHPDRREDGPASLPWEAADAAYHLVRALADDLRVLLGKDPEPYFGWSEDPDASGWAEV